MSSVIASPCLLSPRRWDCTNSAPSAARPGTENHGGSPARTRSTSSSAVRRRVQHAVDRRFNRARYDAERMVTAFAARLQDAVDSDAVRADLATMVQTALEPTHV